MDKRLLRVIDANFNRLLEGLRVCEEITRFVLCNKTLTLELKKIRHRAAGAVQAWKIDASILLASRDSASDVGKQSIKSELKRSTYQDIFFANIQRAKESLRVLEEFAKLAKKKVSAEFKDIRYRLYEIEKKTNPGFRHLRGYRP